MRAALLIVLAMLGGCSREPDFDEQYDAASRQIGASAKKIDIELEERVKEAEAGDDGMQRAEVPKQTP